MLPHLFNLCNERENSSLNSSNEALAAAGRAEITRSNPPGRPSAEQRKISFNRRRTPLRLTAVPTFLETESPSLAPSRVLGKA
jgi:hypothetical protein